MDNSSEVGFLPVVCVIGSWSSGTTAVTGFLARLGAYSCPPHFRTNDPLTPDSHESIELRNRLLRIYDEQTLQRIGQPELLSAWLRPWLVEESAKARLQGCTHIVIKHPLLATLVSLLVEVCNPTFVVVTRPLPAIERTRLRRNWPEVYGAKGAPAIYSTALNCLIDAQQSFLTIAFADFLASPATRDSLVRTLELTPSESQRQSAEAWLRP